mgnify:CR=1 FL=1
MLAGAITGREAALSRLLPPLARTREGLDPRALDAEPHRRAARTFGPVSYTHLRAHETVLDLVCRLLLEKKNNSTDIHLV